VCACVCVCPRLRVCVIAHALACVARVEVVGGQAGLAIVIVRVLACVFVCALKCGKPSSMSMRLDCMARAAVRARAAG
jgi:hypothetical protein